MSVTTKIFLNGGYACWRGNNNNSGGATIFEVDIKKIIALSTLSHLGPMFITLGKGLPLMAFFHLIAHAYFKAILFIRGSFTYLSKSLKKSQGRNRKGDYAAF